MLNPPPFPSYAHAVYTEFMEAQGWVVQKHYLLETAWVATYTHGQGGRVLGINSEMDALPGIGHACGHNLIGIAGVAVACAAKAAMERFNIDGKVILLGTPGEILFGLLPQFFAQSVQPRRAVLVRLDCGIKARTRKWTSVSCMLSSLF